MVSALSSLPGMLSKIPFQRISGTSPAVYGGNFTGATEHRFRAISHRSIFYGFGILWIQFPQNYYANKNTKYQLVRKNLKIVKDLFVIRNKKGAEIKAKIAVTCRGLNSDKLLRKLVWLHSV